MKISIVTLFPEMLDAVTEYGVTGRAVKNGLMQVDTVNPRQFTTDRHETVDHRPYGGGPGMVMMVEPLKKAVEAAKAGVESETYVVYLSPQGKPLEQVDVARLAAKENLVLVAGRYEGVDERFIDLMVDEECSIGDYVLSGGELPAMVLVDAITRLVPGALGHEASAAEDSFQNGLLDCPHYTRPAEYDGLPVPAVLQSGDHGEIRRWRLQQSLGRTWKRRPDLMEKMVLDDEQQAMLQDFIRQEQSTDVNQ